MKFKSNSSLLIPMFEIIRHSTLPFNSFWTSNSNMCFKNQHLKETKKRIEQCADKIAIKGRVTGD